MKEELITFETAKLAKEKGFDIPCNKIYSFGIHGFLSYPSAKFLNGDIYECKQEPFKWNSEAQWGTSEMFCAPTQSLLQRWLREKHDIQFCINCFKATSYTIEISKGYSTPDRRYIGYDTYEEALEKGLQEALKLI